MGLRIRTVVDRSTIDLRRIEAGFYERLQQLRSEEIARGVTTMGPHRDELRFYANNVDLGDYGSRGQVRTTLLALKLAEVAWMKERTSEWPVILLDEVGRGTATYDGLAIAWAAIEYIHARTRARTLFATHYHELTQLSEILPGVRNYNVAVSEADGKVVFLHKIIPGGADRSYGIHVAQLAGIPRPVIQRANEILAQLEATSGKAVKINPMAAQQMALFPQTNPLVDELKELDVSIRCRQSKL